VSSKEKKKKRGVLPHNAGKRGKGERERGASILPIPSRREKKEKKRRRFVIGKKGGGLTFFPKGKKKRKKEKMTAKKKESRSCSDQEKGGGGGKKGEKEMARRIDSLPEGGKRKKARLRPKKAFIRTGIPRGKKKGANHGQVPQKKRGLKKKKKKKPREKKKKGNETERKKGGKASLVPCTDRKRKRGVGACNEKKRKKRREGRDNFTPF